MIYFEEKKYFAVVFLTTAAIVTAALFLQKSPWIIIILLALALLIVSFSGAFFIKKVYKKAIKTEQLLDEVISDEKTESEKDYIEKDSVFASIFEEIRELKKIRESREEEKNRELLWQRNLMSDISHQIKTPLASLEIYTDIFRKEMGDDKEKKELSDRAVEAIERIRWLVTGMLQIAKLESGAYRMEKKTIPIRETIDRAVFMLNPMFSEKNIKVHLEEKKQNDGEILVSQDGKWLEEAFTNILKNAIEYSDFNGQVDIMISDTPMAVSVEIKDYGEGIPEEEVPKIFNRFYKASGQRERRKDSVGIGLNLSKEIIKAHGGTITVESKTGDGSYTSIYTTFLKNSR